MVAKADHTIGPGSKFMETATFPHWSVSEEKKMFNIAYLAGILVILVPWNSIFIGYLATGFSFPIQQVCLGALGPSSRFTDAPLSIGMTFLTLGIIYVALIRSGQHMWGESCHRYLHLLATLGIMFEYVWVQNIQITHRPRRCLFYIIKSSSAGEHGSIWTSWVMRIWRTCLPATFSPSETPGSS